MLRRRRGHDDAADEVAGPPDAGHEVADPADPGQEVTDPPGAPGDWTVVLTGPGDVIEVLAARLREEGVAVVTRQASGVPGVLSGGGWDVTVEVLVPGFEVRRTQALLEHWQNSPTDAADLPAAIDGEPDEDAPEGSIDSLGDMFVAAGRLRHKPWDERAAGDLSRTTGEVVTTSPPYGVDRGLWDAAGQLGGELAALIEAEADDEDVTAAAEALWATLRNYV